MPTELLTGIIHVARNKVAQPFAGTAQTHQVESCVLLDVQLAQARKTVPRAGQLLLLVVVLLLPIVAFFIVFIVFIVIV